jgi:hypothetical protein
MCASSKRGLCHEKSANTRSFEVSYVGAGIVAFSTAVAFHVRRPDKMLLSSVDGPSTFLSDPVRDQVNSELVVRRPRQLLLGHRNTGEITVGPPPGSALSAPTSPGAFC